MKNVLIYNDRGADTFGVSALCAELANPFLHINVTLVDRYLLRSQAWMDNTDLLIFPGGRDIPYQRTLQGDANSNISTYVREGGSYLGICAGGYYACASIEFERGHPLEVIEERDLKFFPGIASGPAYGLGEFSYRDLKSGRIAALSLCTKTFTNSEASAYFFGGCAFLGAEKYENVNILARYADIEGCPAALVECLVGKGRALLSGVHPEYTASHEKANILPQNQFEHLQAIEKERHMLFMEILTRALN